MAELSIYEQLSFCTSRIETEDANGNSYSGTGFFFNLNVNNKIVPLLITNKHVVKGMKKVCSVLLQQMMMACQITRSTLLLNIQTILKTCGSCILLMTWICVCYQ